MPTVYVHLTCKERYTIDMERRKGLGVRAIAKFLGRSPSTVSRELRRNRTQKKAYDFSGAWSRARARRSRQNRLRLYREKRLRRYVDQALERGWSPEQIAGRLSRQRTLKCISPNAVYRYVRRLAKLGDYRINRFRRCPKKRRRKHVRSSGPFAKRPLSERPEAVLLREEIGHWEGDTIVSSAGVPAILVNVERKTRYLIAKKIETSGAAAVTQMMIEIYKGEGRLKLKSIALDNGSEFAGFRQIESQLNVPLYFCNPHSPWEKPTVENSNGLIRQLNRKIDLKTMSAADLDKTVRLLNNRPRKCLKWRTPAEVYK